MISTHGFQVIFGIYIWHPPYSGFVYFMPKISNIFQENSYYESQVCVF